MTTEATELPPTRLDVSGLIDAPGATREVGLDVPVPEGIEVPLTALGDEVAVDGVLESLVDGVLLRGTVEVRVAQQCALCLEPIAPTTVVMDVAELFTDPSTLEDPEDVEVGYEIVAEQIDIDTLIRDAMAAEMPRAPKCRPDCAGLCPSCGANRNDTTCSCADDVTDDRWAKLAELEIDR